MNLEEHKAFKDGRGNRYGYDDEGQLTSASYRATTPETTPTGALRTDIFHYDALGNRQGANYLASVDRHRDRHRGQS